MSTKTQKMESREKSSNDLADLKKQISVSLQVQEVIQKQSSFKLQSLRQEAPGSPESRSEV